MKRILLLSFVFLLFLLAPALLAEEEISAEEIILKVDEVRNPQKDYKTFVKVTSYKLGRDPLTAEYEVLIQGKEKAIIRTVFPPVDRGRIILMLKRDLWVYLPTITKPLRISLAERLMGDVSYGDVARANFSGDYIPQIVGNEKIEEKDCYMLELKANADDVTYSRVVLWVEKETFKPIKAEFYAISGRLLKTCSYEDYKLLGNKIRPTRLTMTDAIIKNQKTVMEYGAMEIKPLPEKYFTKDYMKKFMD